MSIVIEHAAVPTDDVRMLIGELDAELSGHYAAEQRHGLSLDRVFQPGVMFFVARLDGEAVGCGGIAFEDGYAELKRMYVRPQARGRGVARTIVARLEDEARAHDIPRITLETGDAQQAAIRLYERCGFTRCAAFGVYTTMGPAQTGRCIFFEKHITRRPSLFRFGR